MLKVLSYRQYNTYLNSEQEDLRLRRSSCKNQARFVNSCMKYLIWQKFTQNSNTLTGNYTLKLHGHFKPEISDWITQPILNLVLVYKHGLKQHVKQ